MRMSHVCQGCGLDLARERAPLDPVYGLPLVVCPGCGWACVRGRPLRPRPVRSRRSVALMTIGLGAGLLGLLGTGTLRLADALVEGGFTAVLSSRARTGRSPALVGDTLEDVILGSVLMAGTFAFFGAWLGAAGGRSRRPALLAAWGAVLICGVSLDLMLVAPAALARLVGVGHLVPAGTSPPMDVVLTRWLVCLVGLLIATAATPLARRLERAWVASLRRARRAARRRGARP